MKRFNPEWILRIAVFGTFLGHGYFALLVNPAWIPYLQKVGFSYEASKTIMPVIGAIDICVAFTILIKPYRPVILYACVWAFLAALMRPITGESFFQFIERAANFLAPLALLVLTKKKP